MGRAPNAGIRQLILLSAHRRLLALGLVASMAGVSGCVASNRPDPGLCEAPAITIDLTLTASSLTPNDPAVCRDQLVTLRLESEVDGVLHIHGYEEVPAQAVRAGERLDLSFDADGSGQFTIELHTDANAQGVSVGIFTVHEP